MKRLFSILAVTAALAIALGGTLAVSAQGRGGMGMGGVGRGGWTNPGVPAGGGILAGALDPYLAEALGLTVDEFQAARADGQTLYQIALAQGFEAEEIPALMQQARDAAIADAVADGTITQEQADWMAQRGGTRYGYPCFPCDPVEPRGGRFGGHHGFGHRGGGRSGGNLGECPYGYEPGSMGRWNGATTG